MKNILVADKVAISLSALCTIHCLLLPTLLIAMPTLGATLFGDEMFHLVLLFVLIPISVFALMLGCKKHKNWNIFALGMIGLGLLIIAQLLGHDVLGEAAEQALTVLGSCFLIFAHIKNFRLCRSNACQAC